MKRYKIICADLDGTLIETMSGETFPKGIWDMRFKFPVLDKLKELSPKIILIVSNQGGIQNGIVDEYNFKRKLEFIKHSIEEYTGCCVDGTYCSSNDKNCIDRKPNTGMLQYLLKYKYNYLLSKTTKTDMLMIGDASGLPEQFSDSDKRCAENFGIDYLDVEEFLKM
jgi:polynucleotide 3'-phosphatase